MTASSPSFRRLGPSGISAFVIAFACAIALLYVGRVLLITLLVALILAFMLKPSVTLLMRLRLPRALASFVVCAFAVCVVYLAGLAAYTQAAGIVENIPKYSERISETVDQVINLVDSTERQIYVSVVPKRFREQPQQPQPENNRRHKRAIELPPPPVLPPAPVPVPEVRIRPSGLRCSISPTLTSSALYETLLMASFVPFLVYFMLSRRDHVYRSFLGIFQGDSRMLAAKALEGIANMVRAFVVGNFFLGLILAAAGTAVFRWFNLPYPFLIGPVSGFLSLVPYIGMPLAVIPPFVGLLVSSAPLADYGAILTIVAVLHLIALNLLYPKISVGPRVHLICWPSRSRSCSGARCGA